MGLLGEFGEAAMPISGGTDLLPNMKHRLFTPEHLVSLRGLSELRGVVREGTALVIGAGETLATIASHPLVRLEVPALATAAGLVAGPQIRNVGTLGGNLCLDTRCTYYNQTEFWREALGYCLKKDGTVCHVTRVGKKCVAAHSADTPPVLLVLGAELELTGPEGARWMPVEEFFVADGIRNTRRSNTEIVSRIRIPVRLQGHRSAYRKLRVRKAIDFPLLSLAASAEIGEDGTIREIRGVVSGLGSRPRTLTGWDDLAVGVRPSAELCEALAERAHAQCHPLENMVVDPEWRRAMVGVESRRLLQELFQA